MYDKIVTAAEAVSHIPDNAFVAVSGVNFAGTPLELIDAIVERFEKVGHPKNIDLTNSGNNAGMPRFKVEGLVGVYYAGFPSMDWRIPDGGFTDNNMIPVFHFTQGIGTQFYRAQAAGVPYLTKIGFGTYLDPRIDAACANAKARAVQDEKQIIKIVEVGGEQYMHVDLPPVTVALIRGTSCDTDGNLINDDESIKNELLPMAMAAHNNGGVVIAQVKNVVEPGEIDAADVKVPGMLVDYVVKCSDPEKWAIPNSSFKFNPGLTGHVRIAKETVPFDEMKPSGVREIIARRGILELTPGCAANVGLGIPTGIPYIAMTEGIDEMYYQTIELGAVGGYTGSGHYFSGAFNAWAFLDHHEMFAFIDGGGLDITFLGVGDIDETGSVNVTRVKGITNGSGGFVNISTNSKKVVFVTTHTAGGKVDVENGRLKILEPGKPLKFRKKVEQISFSGQEAAKRGQDVLYITERAVFKLIDGKVTLVEIAEGLDIERDVVDAMGFRPEIAKDLKPMPSFVFANERIGLRDAWENLLAKRGSGGAE
jgi:propionate CoA-transferase